MDNQKNIYSNDDCWGITYMFKQGYKKITSNMDEIETTDNSANDWIARFYYIDKRGNVFLKHKKGRKFKIDINPRINLCSDDYIKSIRDEIKHMNDEQNELNYALSELEKMVHKEVLDRRK